MRHGRTASEGESGVGRRQLTTGAMAANTSSHSDEGTRAARVFISYRRGDTSGQARALQETLSNRFGRDSVFMDVDSIGPGVDFVEQIDQAIGSCSVVLALIGRDWVGRGGSDARPLDDANDFVRRELESALQRRVPIIPILIERAPMPAAAALPPSLQPLARLNALELENSRWSFDVSRLGDAIERLSAAPAAASPAAATDAALAATAPAAGAVEEAPPPPPADVPPPPPDSGGAAPQGPARPPRRRRVWLLAGAGAAVLAAVVVVIVILVLPHTTQPATGPSAPPGPTPLALARAVLEPSDFSSGATSTTPPSTPDLTDIKCTPDQTSGLQQQYKSEVTAASGRVYGNVVAAFDNASDAHSFIDTFHANAGSCSDASSPPVTDTLGTLSFSFTIADTPNDLNVETVQVGRYITVVIQVLPAGTQADQQSLNDLTQTSVDKLDRVKP